MQLTLKAISGKPCESLGDNFGCPFCRGQLFRQLATPHGKAIIHCENCKATATGEDVESATYILETVRDDVAASITAEESNRYFWEREERKRALEVGK